MNKIVISQPMFFPWVGFFEQVRLSDIFVYYDDVQFSKGSFVNRVQIKTDQGFKWLTIPLRNLKLGQLINEVEIDDRKDWRNQHIELLNFYYSQAPYKSDILEIVSQVYQINTSNLLDIVVASMKAIFNYFKPYFNKTYAYSSDLQITGSNTQRVLDIVVSLQGSSYITGHGARNYLDHLSFEDKGVRVEYMDYKRTPYQQLHNEEFNPHVSILDLIANMGPEGINWIHSSTKNWREFINESH